MTFLLDTHAFLWWATASPLLSSRARACCENRTNTVLLSVVSV